MSVSLSSTHGAKNSYLPALSVYRQLSNLIRSSYRKVMVAVLFLRGAGGCKDSRMPYFMFAAVSVP